MGNVLVFLCRHLAELVLFVLAVDSYGRLALRTLSFQDGFEQTVVSCALGLGVFASLLNLLGLAGALTRPAVLALIGLPLVFRAARPGAFRRLPWLDRPLGAGAILLGLPLAVCLALALYPPTAFDATLYHLPIAKAFSLRHSVTFLPDLRFPVSPQLFEMLFAGGLSVADDVGTQLVHFFALAIGAAGLVAWARRFATPRAGVWAAAAWLGNPLVIAVGAAAMVDVGLALFCTMALFAWEVWRQRGDSRWLTASAAFAGLAASTKYLGLFFVAALPAATLLARPARGRLRSAAWFAGVAVLTLVPFYWRIVSQTGNPVFPYLSRWFGESAWSEWLDPVASRSEPGESGGSLIGTRARDLAKPRALLQLASSLIVPTALSREDSMLSPFILLIPPLLLWRALADRQARFLVLLGCAYGLCWYFASPDKRFLLPILPAWSVGAAAGLDNLLQRRGGAAWTSARSRLAAIALVFFLLAPGTASNARVVRWRGRLPVTPMERDAYLTRALPVYPALQYLNAKFGRNYVVYVLFRENAAYFADGRFLGDHFGPCRYSVVIGFLSDPPRLREVLHRMGVTHVLIDQTQGSGSQLPIGSYSETFRALPSPRGTVLFALGQS